MLSIVIPTLNEAANIRQLLESLARQQKISLEMIVVDGGSTDGTPLIAREAGARVIDSAPGRGCQLNAGAEAATGEHILFLHADTSIRDQQILSNAVTELRKSEPAIVAGHFALQFDTADTSLSRAMRFFEEKTALNRPGCWNGDQGLLIRKETFQQLGGFDAERPFLEDQEFGRRFRPIGQFVSLPGTILTSARRFEAEGFSARVTLNALIMAMFEIGSDLFFEQATEVYKTHSSTDGSSQINLRPFFQLVAMSIFMNGFLTGIQRFYAIGRYTTRNLWQLFLWSGIRSGDIEGRLALHDRFFRRLVINPFGYLLGTALVVTWFYLTWLVLILRQ